MTDRKITEFITTTSTRDTDIIPLVDSTETNVDNQNKKITFFNFWKPATSTTLGVIKLTGDLGGTATNPTVPGLSNRANVNSPNFTGTPTAPTITSITNPLQIVNLGYLQSVTTPLETDQLAVFLEGFITEKDYPIILNSAYSFKITSITTKSTTGNCFLSIKNSTTTLVNSIAITTIQNSILYSNGLTFNATDNLIVNINNNSVASDVNITIVYSRI
jgi:hypothetical protein